MFIIINIGAMIRRVEALAVPDASVRIRGGIFSTFLTPLVVLKYHSNITISSSRQGLHLETITLINNNFNLDPPSRSTLPPQIL